MRGVRPPLAAAATPPPGTITTAAPPLVRGGRLARNSAPAGRADRSGTPRELAPHAGGGAVHRHLPPRRGRAGRDMVAARHHLQLLSRSRARAIGSVLPPLHGDAARARQMRSSRRRRARGVAVDVAGVRDASHRPPSPRAMSRRGISDPARTPAPGNARDRYVPCSGPFPASPQRRDRRSLITTPRTGKGWSWRRDGFVPAVGPHDQGGQARGPAAEGAGAVGSRA
jgi:hypothetical protein